MTHLVALTGPVFALVVHGATVVTGGKDRSAPIREWRIGRGWPARVEVTPARGADDQGLALNQKSAGAAAQGGGGACVRAMAWNGSEIIVGTSSNSIYTLNPRTGVSKALLHGHSKGAITGTRFPRFTGTKVQILTQKAAELALAGGRARHAYADIC